MPHSECEFPVAPPRRRRKMKPIQEQQHRQGREHEAVVKYTSSAANGDGDVPRPPPRRRRKSHGSRATAVCSRESVLDQPDSGQNTTSSSSSSPSSWYDSNRTTTPVTRSQTDLLQQHNYDCSNHSNAADQFRSPTSLVTNNYQLYPNGQKSCRLHAAVSESVHFDTFPANNDPLSPPSNDDNASDLLVNAINKSCEKYDHEKYDSNSDGGDVLASWKKKNGDLRHCDTSLNGQHCQGSSVYAAVSYPVQLSESYSSCNSQPFQPTICERDNRSLSADDDYELRLSFDDDDDDDSIFASWKKKNKNSCGRVDDNEFPTASPISASGVDNQRDIDNVCTLSGSGNGNGQRTSNGRCWRQVNRPTNGSTWNGNDLETRCADLLAWQRQQRMQRQQQADQRNPDIEELSPRQPHQHADRPSLSEEVSEYERRKPNRKSDYNIRSTFSSENNRKIGNVNRNRLEMNCGGQSPISDDEDRQTGLSSSATAKSNGYGLMNECGAEVSSSGAQNGEEGKEEAASVDSRQNDWNDATETERLASCRTTLLEDVTSSDINTTNPSLSLICSVVSPPNASTSPLTVEVESSTSTTYPDTMSKDVTSSETDTVLSNDDGFSVAVSPSSPETESTYTGDSTSGSRLCGAAYENFGADSVICFEPRSFSVTLPIISGANGRDPDAQPTLLTVEDSRSGGTGNRLNGTMYKDLPAGTSTCGEAKRSDVASKRSDVTGHLLTVEKLVCNGSHMQHPERTADKVYDTTHYAYNEESVIRSEAKSFPIASPKLVSEVSCGPGVQRQSSTVEDSVCSGDRYAQTTPDRANNRSDTDIPWPIKRNFEVETKSGTRGPTPWSFSSYGDHSTGMKGLRIPSATTSSAGKYSGSPTTTTTSQDGRPCLDLPLIAGATARRTGNSSTPSVLPATLLPRPFMPRSFYRSIRPLFLTTSSVRGTDNDGYGNGPTSSMNSVSESTATGAVKVVTPTHSTSSLHHKLIGSDVTASSVPNKPNDQADDRYSSYGAAKASTPVTNGVRESTTVDKEIPACPSATHFHPQLSNEVTVSTDFQDVHVSPNLSASGESPSNADCCQSMFASHPCQKPNGGEITDITDSKSFKDAHASPNVGTPGRSLQISDRQQPVLKLLRPPTMPKPSLPSPAPPAARVADPLPPSSLDHRVGEDDTPATSSDELASRGRTTSDGGSDSEVDQHESSTSSPEQTKMTSTAGHDAPATTTALDLNIYSPPGNHSTASQDEFTTRPVVIEKDVKQAITTERRESDGTEEKAVEKKGINGFRFDTWNNWQNSVEHSAVEQTATSPVSVKLEVKERSRLRDLGQANKSREGRSELPLPSSAERLEEASKDVDGSSHQPEAEMISLEKGIFGLGFCIEGGRDSPTGRAPVTVKRIFRGDVAARFLLSPGDEIISVNGKQFDELSLYEAWNYLKALPDGVVSLCVRRHNKSSLAAAPVLFL